MCFLGINTFSWCFMVLWKTNAKKSCNQLFEPTGHPVWWVLLSVCLEISHKCILWRGRCTSLAHPVKLKSGFDLHVWYFLGTSKFHTCSKLGSVYRVTWSKYFSPCCCQKLSIAFQHSYLLGIMPRCLRQPLTWAVPFLTSLTEVPWPSHM